MREETGKKTKKQMGRGEQAEYFVYNVWTPSNISIDVLLYPFICFLGCFCLASFPGTLASLEDRPSQGRKTRMTETKTHKKDEMLVDLF